VDVRLYAPEVVSAVILRAAEHPLRELIAGGSGAKLSAARFAPRLADLYMQLWTFDSQRTDKPANAPRTTCTNLFRVTEVSGGAIERSYAKEQRVYTSRIASWYDRGGYRGARPRRRGSGRLAAPHHRP
jgi:hypothetical protein